jgi:hypothetical protein
LIVRPHQGFNQFCVLLQRLFPFPRRIAVRKDACANLSLNRISIADRHADFLDLEFFSDKLLDFETQQNQENWLLSSIN